MTEPSPSARPHKQACNCCGGDMTDGQLRRQGWDEKASRRTEDELDSLRAHLRALATSKPGDVRHALVGLLPECAFAPPELREKLPALADVQDARARAAWAEYGYPDGGAP